MKQRKQTEAHKINCRKGAVCTYPKTQSPRQKPHFRNTAQEFPTSDEPYKIKTSNIKNEEKNDIQVYQIKKTQAPKI